MTHHLYLFTELQTKLQANWRGLSDKPEETPESTLRALWLAAAGRQVSAVSAQKHPLEPLLPSQQQVLLDLIEQRMSGIPLAYLTGRQHFMGLDLLVSAQAMIPRVETEILARAALDLLGEISSQRAPSTVMDLCTGCGNIAVSLAVHHSGCKIYAADLSPEAILLARQNADLHNLDGRITFFTGDLFAPFEQETYYSRIDLVTCNPPYISSAQVASLPEEIRGYEPRLAFDGGAFGVSIFQRLVREAPRFLKPGGWLAFEVGAGQGDTLQRYLLKHPAYLKVKSYADRSHTIRALAAQKKAN